MDLSYELAYAYTLDELELVPEYHLLDPSWLITPRNSLDTAMFGVATAFQKTAAWIVPDL